MNSSRCVLTDLNNRLFHTVLQLISDILVFYNAIVCSEVHVIVLCILLSQCFFHRFKCLFVYFSVNVSYFCHCYCVLSTDRNRNVI